MRLDERLAMRVRATAFEPHPCGRSLRIDSEARAGDEVVWTQETTILRRESSTGGGFSRTIAHGMWTKARCLSALGNRLPSAFAVEARFRRPVPAARRP